MPGGQASHKGTGNKPNVNASGVIGEAADATSNPDEILGDVTVTESTRTDEYVDFPPALERPEEKVDTSETSTRSQ